MPRPKKCRKVCSMPEIREFSPSGVNSDFITLTVDEYESVRLIDKEGLSQEECAAYMQVARTTAQQIYACARGKIATALVDGMGIRIEGGDYRLCEKRDSCHACEQCRKSCRKNCKSN